ncbi:MAG: protein kinase [Acidobacteriota bacterium]
MAEDRPPLPDGPTRVGTSATQPGERIGPYRVERLLGSGGMGEVVSAYDERLDRRVAIKRIRHDVHVAATERERFRREARVVARLSHPAIVQVHDILVDESGDAIVMELVQGRSLAERLKEGPLPLGEAVRLGRQVAEGLAEAHRAGLVHRDLKAENVMVTAPSEGHPARAFPGRAKILDFGLAKQLLPSGEDESLTRRGALIGTVRAMSPEQAGGQDVDHRSDLFSLGVLLYEMLTGCSPFRSANVLDTLLRVRGEEPRPPRALRPDTPAELESLVLRLLEKQPQHRPKDADEVSETLEALASQITGADVRLPVSDSDSWSDAPTGSLVQADSSTAAGERSAAARRKHRWLVAVAGLVLLVLLALVLSRLSPGRSEPLRVLVLRPQVVSAEPLAELDLVASGVRIATLAVLADLEGVAPVAASSSSDPSSSPMAIALAEAADEVLAIRVEPRDGSARVFLRRIRGVDGEVLWATGFNVPLQVERARLVPQAISIQLQEAYPDSSLRRLPRLEAEDGDFAEYVQVVQRIDSGEAPLEPELRRLEEIAERSPRFLAVQLRSALVALTLYSDTRDTDYLERAADRVQQARKLAPSDPQALELELRIALPRGEQVKALAVLAELEEVAPNSTEVLFGRYRLARAAGDSAAEEAALEQVVARRPSWGNLYRLADLEVRRGDVTGARRHLEELIRRAPTNPWGLGKLVQLELLYGDLERAEELALRAIELQPHRSYFTNLGLARFYLGDYEGARKSYLQALEIAPEHLTVRLNLADTEFALGRQEEALDGYRRILADLEIEDLEPTGRMTMAQCLARLGHSQQAVAMTLETLQKHPDHAEVAYQAALVYALVGEPASAIVSVERALARGFQPRQFAIPSFDSLRSDARFKALVDPQP